MTPLVLVHGFMGGAAQWEAQVAALSPQRPVIALDLPGFGAANHVAPIDSIEGFANWVVSELDAQGVGRFDLLGHSMGGMIVQEVVRLVPERVGKLILYATGSVGVLPGRFETIAESKARTKADGAEVTARRIAATWFLAREAAAEYPACAAIAEKSGLPAILSGLAAMQGWSGEDHLAAIGVRTLILWGDRDRTYPWSQTERLWRTIPDASLAVVPGCAHAVHMEWPQLFNMAVGGFLAEA